MRRPLLALAAIAILAATACGKNETPAPVPTASPGAKAEKPASRDGRAESADGTSIAYTDTGTGDGALVFVHCWSCDRSYWEAQVEDLARDYRVVTVDLAGHGDSGADRKDWTIEAFGHDVEAVVNALKLRTVVLIGHSMGGFVVIEAARLLPGRVIGLIGVDTLHDVEMKFPKDETERMVKGLERDFAGTCKPFVKSMFLESSEAELVTEVTDDMCSAPPPIAIASLRAATSYDAAAGLDAAKVPLRCINGTHIPTNVETNQKHTPSFHVYPIENTGHFPMLERPVEFNRILRQAVEELTGPK
jgi:pimeloyl-ACP methyl ester carboxylesterase